MTYGLPFCSFLKIQFPKIGSANIHYFLNIQVLKTSLISDLHVITIKLHLFRVKRAIPVLIILFLIPGLSGAQTPEPVRKNLVPNGSFENFRKKSGSIRQAIPWAQIGSVDFYQAPVEKDTGYMRGGYNSQCYIGLRFQKRYKEFAQVRLAEPLHRGTTYEFEMHVRLAHW